MTARPRFLVRFRLDLFLSGGDADGPLASAAGVAVTFRPFLLGPIFKAQGWATSPFNLYPAKGRNMWRDLERLCADLALPFRRPEPFPQNSLLAARVALVGLADRWGEEFCRAVFRAEFADGRRIDDTETMGDILSKLDVDPSSPCSRPRSPTTTRRGCEPRPKRRNGSASSARRPSSPPTANCSGATTGWNARSPGRTAARLGIEPHRQAGARHVLLGCADRVFAEMEDRGGEHRGGMAVADALDQMIESADAARSDDRHRHGVGDRRA